MGKCWTGMLDGTSDRDFAQGRWMGMLETLEREMMDREALDGEVLQGDGQRCWMGSRWMETLDWEVGQGDVQVRWMEMDGEMF